MSMWEFFAVRDGFLASLPGRRPDAPTDDEFDEWVARVG